MVDTSVVVRPPGLDLIYKWLQHMSAGVLTKYIYILLISLRLTLWLNCCFVLMLVCPKQVVESEESIRPTSFSVNRELTFVMSIEEIALRAVNVLIPPQKPSTTCTSVKRRTSPGHVMSGGTRTPGIKVTDRSCHLKHDVRLTNEVKMKWLDFCVKRSLIVLFGKPARDLVFDLLE